MCLLVARAGVTAGAMTGRSRLHTHLLSAASLLAARTLLIDTRQYFGYKSIVMFQRYEAPSDSFDL